MLHKQYRPKFRTPAIVSTNTDQYLEVERRKFISHQTPSMYFVFCHGWNGLKFRDPERGLNVKERKDEQREVRYAWIV